MRIKWAQKLNMLKDLWLNSLHFFYQKQTIHWIKSEERWAIIFKGKIHPIKTMKKGREHRKAKKLQLKVAKYSLQRTENVKTIPVCKASWPSKDRGYAVCTGFTSFLMNPEMTCHCPMGSFSFYGLSIWTNLKIHNTINE